MVRPGNRVRCRHHALTARHPPPVGLPRAFQPEPVADDVGITWNGPGQHDRPPHPQQPSARRAPAAKRCPVLQHWPCLYSLKHGVVELVSGLVRLLISLPRWKDLCREMRPVPSVPQGGERRGLLRDRPDERAGLPRGAPHVDQRRPPSAGGPEELQGIRPDREPGLRRGPQSAPERGCGRGG